MLTVEHCNVPISQRIVAAARSYIGTPWRNMGRNAAGLDCIGLILAVGHDAGVFTYDPGSYGRETSLRETKRHFAKFCDTVPFTGREPGDFTIFVAPGWIKPHASIIAHDSRGRETMIHALPTNRKVIEDRLSADWLARLVAVYRVRG